MDQPSDDTVTVLGDATTGEKVGAGFDLEGVRCSGEGGSPWRNPIEWRSRRWTADAASIDAAAEPPAAPPMAPGARRGTALSWPAQYSKGYKYRFKGLLQS